MLDFSKVNIKYLILDMDGVLWKDSQTIGDLPQIFDSIRNLNLKVVLATNNATRTPEQYLQKLAGLGVQLEPWQIATSGQATSHYLHSKYPIGARIHVMGEAGLVEHLASEGFTITDSDVQAVVVGVDRSVSYQRISTAASLIRSGAEFIGTNPDRTFPTPTGLTPGAGSIIAAVAAAAECEPLMMGKPNSFLLNLALERMNATVENTLMVGDRLDTDILAAQQMNCRNCLVLSGVTTKEQAEIWNPSPTFIFPSLADLVSV
jgi:4-nitrophenyl phosphatase